MFADAEISPVAIDCLCPKTVGWIWRAVAHEADSIVAIIAIILFYLQELLDPRYNTNSVRTRALNGSNRLWYTYL